MNQVVDFIDFYRNPIFGILALLAIILLIASIDSIKKNLNRKKRREFLNNISKNFENTDLNQSIKTFMDYDNNQISSLMLIAKTYSQAGNNDEAIAIYKTLNEYSSNTKQKIEILESLGECYYNAGFLERSKEIFEEILRIYPHNISILQHYIRTCEKLRQYDLALEAIECLETILKHDNAKECSNIKHTKNYLKTMIIINNHTLTLIEQQEKLLEIYDLDSTLHSVILRHLRIYNTGIFWQKILDLHDPYPYIDILWLFQKHEIPFDYIKEDSKLANIYRAKGYIKNYIQIDNFALESLQLLNIYSNIKGDLEFTYRCKICGATSPFYAYNCPSCNESSTIKLIIKPIEKKYNE